jgi:hypothetical protein
LQLGADRLHEAGNLARFIPLFFVLSIFFEVEILGQLERRLDQ